VFAFKREYTKNFDGIQLQTLDFSDPNIYLIINTVLDVVIIEWKAE